jgi:hypothetical protein
MPVFRVLRDTYKNISVIIINFIQRYQTYGKKNIYDPVKKTKCSKK